MRIAPTLLALLLVLPAAAQDATQPAPDPAPAPVDVPGFWTAPELAAIDEGLAVVNASRADLGFFKRPIEDAFRLDVVNRALDEPLSMGREAASWDEVCRRGDVSAILARQIATLRPPAAQVPVAPTDVAPLPDELKARLPLGAVDVLPGALADLASAAALVTSAFEPCGAERDDIVRKTLLSQVEKPSEETKSAIADDAFLPAARKPDLDKILRAGEIATRAAAALVAALKDGPVPAWSDHENVPGAKNTIRIMFRSSPLRIETPSGLVLVYGNGPDTHVEQQLHPAPQSAPDAAASPRLLVAKDSDAILVIDLGGNDTYLGEEDISTGGALGGVAIHWDCGGNDTYRAGHCSLGAGILGVGVLVDEGGDDVFRAKDFCEGAGAFGVGILLKTGGNDLYHADLYGEGFASTWGCGVLADLGGNDVYDAGGAHVDLPLYRDRYTALSQGFAIGMRPDASGGVGVLVDVAGNDRYQTDIYGQGSSYWYSLGLLIDDDGHDTYNGTHYCQGTGIHLSAGMLLDRAGNDSYHCLNGVGVGGSHDFAAGILLDRGGDDHYSGSGASQGCGHTNGVGILLDDAGDDGYCAVHGLTQGDASTVRGSGGIGLLLDQGGKDVYSESTRDDGVWVRGVVGAGIDHPSDVPAGPGGPQAPIITKAAAAAKVEAECKTGKDGKRDWDLDKLWAMSGEWAVNDNSVIVPIAREQFVALGDPAVDRAFERLRSCGVGSGLEFEAVQAVMKLFAATDRKAAIQARLLEKTKDDDHLTRRGAVAVIASLQVADAVPRLVEMLKTDEKNRRSIIGALGALKQAPPEVAGYLRSKAELEGVNAATCLGGVGDEASIAALVGALGPDVPFLTRTAVTEQLAALGGKAVPALGALVRDASAPGMSRRNALRALGRSGHADAVDPIVDSFLSADPWIRISAYGAAKELIPKSNEVDAAELAKSLEAARAIEKDPLAKRLR